MPDPDVTDALARLVDLMARLRAPGGCPWDREQTHATLRPYLLEEAYEVLDAIERGDPAALRDELGDLLLQVVFHAELAREAGTFTVGDVATAIAEKLVRRHPHVFSDVAVRDADDVMRNWRQIKAAQRSAPGEPPRGPARRRAGGGRRGRTGKRAGGARRVETRPPVGRGEARDDAAASLTDYPLRGTHPPWLSTPRHSSDIGRARSDASGTKVSRRSCD